MGLVRPSMIRRPPPGKPRRRSNPIHATAAGAGVRTGRPAPARRGASGVIGLGAAAPLPPATGRQLILGRPGGPQTIQDRPQRFPRPGPMNRADAGRTARPAGPLGVGVASRKGRSMSRYVTNVLSRLRLRRPAAPATALSPGRPVRGCAASAHAVEPLERRALLAAVTFPSAPGVELQTSGPLQAATVGDWYTASGT